MYTWIFLTSTAFSIQQFPLALTTMYPVFIYSNLPMEVKYEIVEGNDDGLYDLQQTDMTGKHFSIV